MNAVLRQKIINRHPGSAAVTALAHDPIVAAIADCVDISEGVRAKCLRSTVYHIVHSGPCSAAIETAPRRPPACWAASLTGDENSLSGMTKDTVRDAAAIWNKRIDRGPRAAQVCSFPHDPGGGTVCCSAAVFVSRDR